MTDKNIAVIIFAISFVGVVLAILAAAVFGQGVGAAVIVGVVITNLSVVWRAYVQHCRSEARKSSKVPA